jgi:outer membrane lipoprotein-sorting protein
MRKAALFWVAAALLVCLAGCGGGKKEAGGEPAPAKSSARQKTSEEPLAEVFAKGKKIEGMSYEYILTVPAGKMTGRVWMQGKKVRTEGTVSGQRIITLVDGETNTVYTYYPDQNRAVKLSAGEQGEETQSPTDYIENTDLASAKILETTVYDGVKCRVVLVQSQDGSELRMWVREDYGLPVRVETTAPDGTKAVMEYKNLKVGPQPPETFKLPAGVQVTDLNEMMKGLPRVPGAQ